MGPAIISPGRPKISLPRGSTRTQQDPRVLRIHTGENGSIEEEVCRGSAGPRANSTDTLEEFERGGNTHRRRINNGDTTDGDHAEEDNPPLTSNSQSDRFERDDDSSRENWDHSSNTTVCKSSNEEEHSVCGSCSSTCGGDYRVENSAGSVEDSEEDSESGDEDNDSNENESHGQREGVWIPEVEVRSAGRLGIVEYVGIGTYDMNIHMFLDGRYLGRWLIGISGQRRGGETEYLRMPR